MNDFNKFKSLALSLRNHVRGSMLKARIILFIVAAWATITVHSQRPPSPEELYEKAIDHLNEAAYTKALGLFNECIKLAPKFAEAYAGRAEVRERLNDPDGAMVDYAICVELLPDQFDPLFSLAVIRYELKLYYLARQDFLKLKRLPPGVTNRIIYRQTAQGTGTDKIMTAQGGVLPDIYNYLGLIETQLQNCRRGIAYLDSAILMNPSEADYYVNRALSKQACNDSSAQEDFRKALAINPAHSLTRHNVAVQRSNSPDQAEGQLTDIIHADSTLQYPFIARGYSRLTKGDYKGALEDYTKALKIDGSDPHLWLNRGISREKLNDLAGAFSDYTQAIELNESFPTAWLHRGNVLLKQGRFKDAIEDYTAAIIYQPGYGHAYFNRALAKHYDKQSGCDDLVQAEALGMEIDKSVRDELCR